MRFLPPPRNVNNCTVNQFIQKPHRYGVFSLAKMAIVVSLALSAATANAVDTIYMGGGEIKGKIDGNVDYTEGIKGSTAEGLGVMGQITGTLTARNGYEYLPNDPDPKEWTPWVNVFDGADIGTVYFKKNERSTIGSGILDGTAYGVEETKGDYQGYHIGLITADNNVVVAQLLLTGGYKNKIDKVDVPVMKPGMLLGLFTSSATVGDVIIGEVLENNDKEYHFSASFDIAGSMKSLTIKQGTIHDIILWSYDGADYQVHTATLGSSNPKDLKDNVALNVGAKFGSIFLKPRTQILGNIQLSGNHDPELSKSEIPGIDAKANAIINLGTLAGSLTNSGTGNIAILNRGTFTADNGNKPNLIIPQNGTGSFTINEWNVAVESNPGQTDSTLNRDRVSRNTAMIVDGATQDNFKVKKVVINKLNSTYPEPYIDMKTAILNKNGGLLWDTDKENANHEKWKPDSIGTVEFSPELQAYGLTGTYYPEEGVFGTDLEVKQTASSILAQSLVNSLARRQVFVEAALADVSQSGLYHSMEYQQGHT